MLCYGCVTTFLMLLDCLDNTFFHFHPSLSSKSFLHIFYHHSKQKSHYHLDDRYQSFLSMFLSQFEIHHSHFSFLLKNCLEIRYHFLFEVLLGHALIHFTISLRIFMIGLSEVPIGRYPYLIFRLYESCLNRNLHHDKFIFHNLKEVHERNFRHISFFCQHKLISQGHQIESSRKDLYKLSHSGKYIGLSHEHHHQENHQNNILHPQNVRHLCREELLWQMDLDMWIRIVQHEKYLLIHSENSLQQVHHKYYQGY